MKNKCRPDLLPTVNRPGKPSDETLNMRDNFMLGDFSFADVDTQALELIKGRCRDAFAQTE